MTRGQVISVAAPGDYGKPRPALIVQSNFFSDHPSLTVCLMTSDLREVPLFRFTVQPTPENGLESASQVMVDKIVTVAKDKVRNVIGRLTDQQMSEVTRLIALWLGIL